MPRRVHSDGSGMSDHRTSAAGKASLSLSIVLGMILVPLTAVAAVIIVSPDLGQVPVPGAAVHDTVGSSTIAMRAASSTVPEPLATDLADACGPAGRRLVDQEKEGSISDTQQAALDALRPVCDAVDVPLPAASEQHVETIVVESSVTGPPSLTSTISGHDDDHDDDDHDDDDRDDDDRDDEWEDD